jgi:hypothetical protein
VPNIRTFDVPQEQLAPSEIGIESTAAAARRGGTFYNQAAAALEARGQQAGSAIKDAGGLAIKWQQQREISKGAADFAQMDNSFTRQWQIEAKNTNGDDPTVATRFRAGMEPAFDKFKNSFLTEGGRLWAEDRIDQYRRHMFEKTNADMASAASDALHSNLNRTSALDQNTLYNDASPRTLAEKFNAIDKTIEGLASNTSLSPAEYRKAHTETADEIKQKYVTSTITGIIDKGGDTRAWRKIATDPKYAQYIDAGAMHRYGQREEFMQRAIERDAKSAEAEEKRANQNSALDRADELRTKYINPDTGEYTFPKNFRQQVLTDPVLAKYPAARVALLRDYDQIERGTKDTKLAAKSLQTWRTLAGQINRGEITNEQPILDQIDNLTRTDLNDLVKRLQESRSPDGQTIGKDRDNFIKKFGPLIDGDYKFQYQQHSLLGSQQMYQFEWDARAKENVVRQEGRDPHGVYNPSSPDYFGAPANISRYRVSAQEAQAYEKLQKDIDKATSQENKNLTGPGKTVTGTEVIDIPPGMTPAQALEWARNNNVSVGTSLRLPDGRIRPMPPEPPKAAGPEVPKGR